MKLNGNQKGLSLALLSPALYTLKSVVVKAAPPASLEVLVFLYFLFSFLILLPFFIKYRDRLRTQRHALHMLRGVLAIAAVYCSIYGLRQLTLMDATLLENTISLFIPLTAWIWLRQKISAFSWLLLLLGFFAVLLILKPQFDILCFATFAPLGCALLSAVSGVAVTSLSRTDHLLTILFYFHLWGLGLALIPLCLFWQGTFSMPESYTFIFLGSLIGVSFQYVMNKAFTLLSPHIVANFTYFNVLFSAVLGWLIWQEVMNGMQLLGGALLIGVGLLVRRQTQLKPKEEIDLAS